MKASIKSYFHEDTFTFCHWVRDDQTGMSAIIDPVLGFDQKSGRTDTVFMDQILEEIKNSGSHLEWVMETHAHADHLSAADYVRACTGARVVIGQQIVRVQKTFAAIYNEGPDLALDGSQFDRLVADADELELGSSRIRVIATPGHTPACVSYLLNDRDIFVGDTLFAPDVGTARCDFPGGDAATLYQSIQSMYALGDAVVMHFCHDYPPAGRAVLSQSTVAEQKAANIHVRDGIDAETFIRMRAGRDATLDMPRLILPSLQVNIRAGALPAPEANGISYLKLPLNQF